MYLLASPTNPIYEEIYHFSNYSDPSTISREHLQELFYQNLNLLRALGLKDASKYFSILNIGDLNSLKPNLSLYKNQYRPMKKGVTNMVKLHATGAIAMPIEVRLHLLASSKDVIHS